MRAFGPDDVAWADGLIGAAMGGRMQARRGELIDVLDLPGFVAERDGHYVGVLTYATRANDVEIAYVEATESHTGIGTALVSTFLDAVSVRPVWVVTTNDNLDALGFYQRHGFAIRDIRVGAVKKSRETIKPSIGRIGEHGIEIRDEIELEYR